MSTAEQTDDIFDKDGNKIVFRDPPVAPAPALPAPEYDERGNRVSRMGGAGARATRGMEPSSIVRDHWNKGIADDGIWLQLYAACIQRHGAGEIDLPTAADEADLAYFEWWQRREASNTGA